MKLHICDAAAWPLWFRPIAAMQSYLRFIGNFYPAIPRPFVNGYFGGETVAAVQAFQQEFNLPTHGRIDLATWDMIIEVWQGLESLAVGGGEFNLALAPGDTVPVLPGERNNRIVPVLQAVLNDLAQSFDNMPQVLPTGVYDEQTAGAVQQFRQLAALPGDGTSLDRNTWNRLLAYWNSLAQ